MASSAKKSQLSFQVWFGGMIAFVGDKRDDFKVVEEDLFRSETPSRFWLCWNMNLDIEQRRKVNSRSMVRCGVRKQYHSKTREKTLEDGVWLSESKICQAWSGRSNRKDPVAIEVEDCASSLLASQLLSTKMSSLERDNLLTTTKRALSSRTCYVI